MFKQKVRTYDLIRCLFTRSHESLPEIPFIYRTKILPVVLYGCESWSLILREKRKLRVSENMVLRKIFGPRRD